MVYKTEKEMVLKYCLHMNDYLTENNASLDLALYFSAVYFRSMSKMNGLTKRQFLKYTEHLVENYED
jgi:hypothetical protein